MLPVELNTDRSYGDLCLRFDVMIVGPGSLWPYDEAQYAHLGDIRNSLRRFCLDARRGEAGSCPASPLQTF
jgi:hypothetical protein